MLWGLAILMVGVTVAGLAMPLVRRPGAGGARGSTLAVLKAQLAELEASGDPEADGLRAEVRRRILAEGREAALVERPLSDRARTALAIGLAAAVALSATGLYLAIGRPDLAEGGRTTQAPPEYLSARGEALVRAAGGRVTPEALAQFDQALRGDPFDPRARFFLALAQDQAGDHDGAMEAWVALINAAPPDAAWAPDVRAAVERRAAERGVDLTGRLKPDPIRAMVDRLDARLRNDPKDAEGWIRLMRSRLVLDQPDKAAEAYRLARETFAGDPRQLTALRQAARQLGVPET